MNIAEEFFASILNAFMANKRLAEQAFGQLPEEKLRRALDPHTNSIFVIMKHIAGNLRSRWTDFLTSDGEKPNRNRDDEFIDDYRNQEQAITDWDSGWQCLFDTISQLTENDLTREVMIRGESHTVPLALQRSLGHTCYHIGQIVQLARHLAGDTWETLTIPRGGSLAFNARNWGQVGKSHS